ncbi:MAG: hypothetical protein HY445_02490 [Candidatus Niyogibacteria bacterium]|nr:hypothetical protein [Candidatus Niyogibacteria bacterium]
MLTDQDIQKIINVVATKEDVQEIKEEVSALKESIQALSVSVDKLAKAVEDMHKEYVVITHRVDRHEKWLQQIADKVGVKLEF